MTANAVLTDNELIEQALAWLRERLPPTWDINRSARPELAGAGSRADALLEIRGSNAVGTLVVEAKSSFGTRDVDRLLGTMGRLLRALTPYYGILVVAPWLSPRTRERLAIERINYIDLTGNAQVQLDNPGLFIQSQGASRNPTPKRRSKATVRGPKAWRLMRFLVEVPPPYGVRELAALAELNAGYVSRLLDTLDDEALIERSPRGAVEQVNVSGLLSKWSDSYDLFKANRARTYLAPVGAPGARDLLRSLEQRTAVTGSFAAVRIAAISAPELLCIYTDNAREVEEGLRLIATKQGANVVLLAPNDPVVWIGLESDQGVNYVAPVQVAVDCLTGNGRMPEEGRAITEWMTYNPNRWRRLQPPRGNADG
jgi:hypothetical protein